MISISAILELFTHGHQSLDSLPQSAAEEGGYAFRFSGSFSTESVGDDGAWGGGSRNSSCARLSSVEISVEN
jgi:hypothetical protein